MLKTFHIFFDKKRNVRFNILKEQSDKAKGDSAIMKEKNYKRLGKKIFIYCLGLFTVALGVSFSVKSDLGVSPVNSIPYVISLFSGIEQGRCVTVIFICFIGLQFVISPKTFSFKNLLQIIGSTVFGYFVTAANMLTVGIPACTNYLMRLLYLFVSKVLIAIGVSLYMKPALLPLPAEGIMQALVDRFGIRFPNAKSGVDTTMVVIATILSFVVFGKLNGVREGTVIAALGIGQLVKIWNKVAGDKLTNFLKK